MNNVKDQNISNCEYKNSSLEPCASCPRLISALYMCMFLQETAHDPLPTKRVRWFPRDTDETFDGTVIEEKANFYVVIPDQNLELTQNWNKKYCDVI